MTIGAVSIQTELPKISKKEEKEQAIQRVKTEFLKQVQEGVSEKDAFKNCENLTAVYYQGTEAEWALINIERKNDSLLAATRYYYSEAEPTVEGNFWHYVDGVPTVWGASE